MTALADLVDAIERFHESTPNTEDDGWRSLSAHVPEQFTFTELLRAVSDTKMTSPRTRLVAILACLKSKEKARREPDDGVSIQSLCDHVARIVAPCSDHDGEDDPEDERSSGGYEQVAQRSRGVAVYGLEILAALAREYAVVLGEDALLTVVSFAAADPSDPWATREACRLAASLLRDQLSQHRDREALIVDTILARYLRPLFSRSRPKTVTASGRKAEFPDEDDAHRGLRDDTGEVKPWKYTDHRAVTVFSWVVQTADETLVSKHWPLFIPVLLALLDDGTTRIRSRGLVILAALLSKFPDNLLRHTGLASVFEDAVFPTLNFLPSITPEGESIQLLVPAYSALLALASKVNGKADTTRAGSSSPKAKLLDKMLREGVFSAYFHAKEHIRIVEVLLLQAARIVNEMGIHAVKHLKDLIPMHSEIMTNPFAALAPSTLLAAIKSLQATITNCWPRLSTPSYQNELIKTLTVCWLTVHDDRDKLGPQSAAIEAELIKTASILSVATKGSDGKEDLRQKVTPLIVKEPLLAKLFK